jgi:uncharacterized protein
MPKGRIQRIQDSVHGLMEFEGVEGVIVDLLRTPELQRLRSIRQLGLASYVFPGAEHSRFAHSLGASHLAVRFSRRIRLMADEVFAPSLCPDEMAVRDMAVAALCHDLGHGPFSHAWEHEIIGDFDRAAWATKLGLSVGDVASLEWHEMVGHALLLWPDGTLSRLLEQHEIGSSKRISELLRGRFYIPYLSRLLAGDIDVDRADFIRRDTYMSGVGYGRYDLDWLISTCKIGETSIGTQKEWVVGFDSRKAIRGVEQFLIARRALYETVYWHKTVRCAEGMMALFLRRLKRVVKDGSKFMGERFFRPLIAIINGEPLAPHDLLALDDSTIHLVVDAILRSDVKDDTVRDLARRIAERDLFKIVPVAEEALQNFTNDPDWKSKLCEAIKPYTRGESEYYFHLDSRRFQMMSTRPGEKLYLVNSDRTAEPASDNRAFQAYRDYQARTISLFTLREAVNDVRKLVASAEAH